VAPRSPKTLLLAAAALCAVAGCGGGGAADATGCERQLWYPDGDGDGYGVEQGATSACDPPDGTAERTGDCDDDRADVHPGRHEMCDGIDNDCDPSTPDAGVSGVSAAGVEDLTGSVPAPPQLWAVPRDLTQVTFCAGTHAVGLVVTSDLAIRGSGSSRGDVVLSGAGEVAVLQVAGDDVAVSLSHLTITDAAPSDAPDGVGWSVTCEGSSEVVAQGVSVTTAAGVGGFTSAGCDLQLSGVALTGVVPTDDGEDGSAGGVAVSRGSLSVTDGTFLHNSGISGDLADMRLTGVTIASHRSTFGAAFEARASDVVLSGVVIDDTRSAYNPAATFESFSAVRLTDVTFSRGRSDDSASGAAVLVGFGTEVEGSSVTFNQNVVYDLEYTTTTSGSRALYGDLGAVATMSCDTERRDCVFSY
jgi:hypothetical protein